MGDRHRHSMQLGRDPCFERAILTGHFQEKSNECVASNVMFCVIRVWLRPTLSDFLFERLRRLPKKADTPLPSRWRNAKSQPHSYIGKRSQKSASSPMPIVATIP